MFIVRDVCLVHSNWLMVWIPHRLVKSVFQGHWQLQARWPETSGWLWSHFWRMQEQEQRLKSLQMMPGLWGVPSLHLLYAFIFLYHHQIRVCNEIFLFLQWPSKNSTWLANKIKKTHQFIISKTSRQCQTFKYINGLEYFSCPPGYKGDTSVFYLMHYSLYSFWYYSCFWKRITLNFYLITSSGKLYLTSWAG